MNYKDQIKLSEEEKKWHNDRVEDKSIIIYSDKWMNLSERLK